jgi:hypothetical protein
MRGGSSEKGGNMRRFLQWAFNGAAIVSAVLFLAACGIWIRSYQFQEEFQWCGISREFVSRRGSIWLCYYERSLDEYRFHYRRRPNHPFLFDWGGPDPGFRRHWRLLGFHWHVTDGGPDSVSAAAATSNRSIAAVSIVAGWDLVVPYWAIVVALAPLPIYRARAYRPRRQPGCCVVCGYDLRATPARCPECGAAKKAKGARASINGRKSPSRGLPQIRVKSETMDR